MSASDRLPLSRRRLPLPPRRSSTQGLPRQTAAPGQSVQSLYARRLLVPSLLHKSAPARHFPRFATMLFLATLAFVPLSFFTSASCVVLTDNACLRNSDCPSGQSCVANVCAIPSDAGADATSDADPDADIDADTDADPDADIDADTDAPDDGSGGAGGTGGTGGTTTTTTTTTTGGSGASGQGGSGATFGGGGSGATFGGGGSGAGSFP